MQQGLLCASRDRQAENSGLSPGLQLNLPSIHPGLALCLFLISMALNLCSSALLLPLDSELSVVPPGFLTSFLTYQRDCEEPAILGLKATL